MADQEIINVLLKLENPQVLDRVERLKSEQFQIKFSGSLDQGIKDILAIKDKKISIVADVQGAINSLKQVETSLKSLQGLQEIKINLSGNVEKDLDRIGKKALELQAKLYAAELTQLGLVQNYNPKTFSGGDKEIRQAQVLRGINEQTVVANRRAPITQQQIDAARTNEPVQRLVEEVTAPYNPGQIHRTQKVGEDLDAKAVAQARVRRLEADIVAKEKSVVDAFDSAFAGILQDLSKPSSGASSVIGAGTTSTSRLGKLAEDTAIEKQAKESAAAREKANAALNERRIRQNFLAETGTGPQAVRTPLNRVGRDTSLFQQFEGANELNQALEIASTQKREEALARLRATKDQDEVDFHQEVFRGTKNVVEGISTRKAAQEASRVAQLRELGQSAALGALQGQGALSVGGSLLGSLAGAAVPGGAAFGGLVGGALGASAERTIESITRALEKASEAGLSFETSILGISSVLQATTRVSGPGGEALGLGDQLSFQQGQARSIQKLARTKLLPLGISGDKESTLVQSIISGAAQRGIQLTPEQAATLAERLGGAIQSQRPELLGNSGQLRRDVEDLFSGAPQNTVLKTLTKGFAPGLGKATSAEDLIKRSEGLASFPETLRSSTTNPVVAAQKLNSAVDNLNTTVGDALVTALIPGVNALAKELANPQLLDGVEKMGAAIGGVASFFATASAGLIGLTTDAVRLVTSIPGAAGGLIGVAARRAIGRGSSAENDLLELQEKKKGGFFSDEQEINKQIAEAQKRFDKENIKNKVTPKASVELAKALRGSGIEDLNTSASPDLKSGAAILASLEEASKQIRKETLEGIQDAEANNKDPKNFFSKIDVGARIKDLLSNETTQRLGLSFEKVGALRKAATDNQSLFDTSSPLGLVNKATDDVEGKAAIRAELENTVKLAEAKRAELKKDALPEDVKKANESVRAATYELIKARNDEREAVDKLKESEISRAKVLRDSQFDPRTLQGQAGLIQSGIQDAESRIGKATETIRDLQTKLSNTTNPADIKNIQSEIEKAQLEFNRGQVDRSGLSAQAQNNVISVGEGAFNAQKAIFDFQQANEVAAEKLLSFADKIGGLNDQAAALSEQLAKSQRSLADFDASKQLRELGREGSIVDAAEKAYKAAEGNFGAENEVASKLPPELRAITKGDFLFSQEARDRFEKEKGLRGFDDVLRKNTPERFATEEEEARNGLLRSISGSKRGIRELDFARNAAFREQEALPFEEKSRQFQLLRSLVGANQQGIDIGSNGQETIQQQLKNLGIDLPALQGAEPILVNKNDPTQNPYGTDTYYRPGDKFQAFKKDPRFAPFEDRAAFSARSLYNLPGGKFDPVTGSDMQGFKSTDEDTAEKFKSLGIKNILKSFLPFYTDVLDNQTTGDPTNAIKFNYKGPNGDLKNPIEFAKDNSLFDVATPELSAEKMMGTIGKTLRRAALPLTDFFNPESTEQVKGEVLPLKREVFPLNDNPINFSDSLIARPSVPSRAYNPILREGLNEGLGNKSDAKTNAVLEDVVGGFLDADVDGLKKQNRAPASGLKNGLFSGGLFGDREDVKSGKGTVESNFADSVGAKIDENFNKLGDIISKALGGAL